MLANTYGIVPGMQTPTPLTADERTRLEALEARPDSEKSRQEKLEELTLTIRREEWSKYRFALLVRDLLPADQPPARGALTEVTAATPYTREYIARVRDKKALNYTPPATEARE